MKNSKTKNSNTKTAFQRTWKDVRQEMCDIHNEYRVFLWMEREVTLDKAREYLRRSFDLIKGKLNKDELHLKNHLYTNMYKDLEGVWKEPKAVKKATAKAVKPKQDKARHALEMQIVRAKNEVAEAKDLHALINAQHRLAACTNNLLDYDLKQRGL